MLERVKGFFMNILSYFKTTTIDEVTGINTGISADMLQRIELLCNMSQGRAPWNKDAKPCGILPQIAGRLNYFVSREIGLTVENDIIARPLKHLNDNIDKVVEYMALRGSGLLRPVYVNSKLQYEIIPLGNYLPTQYDFDGTLTGCIVLKQLAEKKRLFILCEEHKYDGVNHYTTNRLYENKDSVLREVPLTSCTQTAELLPAAEWKNCGRPMVVEFRTHAVNNIDGSNVPVALINDAIGLIEKADKQFTRMDWEQEAGKKRVFADRDMFERHTSKNGDTDTVIMDDTLKTLITKIDGDGSANGQKITEYSPELRTAAQNEYLQQIFRRIELTINVGKGTVSDAEAVQQTATQYSGGRQELYAIVDKIEDEIAAKYNDAAEIFAYMARAYKITGAPAENDDELFSIKWNDDQTRKDITQAKQMSLQEISAGVLNKWEYRRDYYGEDETTAKANVPPEPAAAAPFGLV